MAISGEQQINIGLQNESIGSDSLYVAFNKTKNNFANLFACASPYSNFIDGNGISTTTDVSSGSVTITNTGVTGLIAGTNVTLSSSNGNVTISAAGGNGGGTGTVTSVGISSTTLSVSGGNIVSSGNITVNLPSVSGVAGSYTYPTMTVDQYGRISNITSAGSVGTVTSVTVSPGNGIQVTGSPITTSGNITITNTGVTRLNAGSGIVLSGTTGNITVSTSTAAGTVTSVGISSSTLTVSGSPVTGAGTITVDIPANVTVSGRFALSGSENLLDGGAANLYVTASYFTTTGPSTATLAAGTPGLIKTFMLSTDGGDMVLTVTNAGWKTSGTGTITFNDVGDGCTLQYINSKWFCIGQNNVVFG